MQKILVLLAAVFGLINFGQAQEPTEKTLLWQVSGNGLKQPSYLYGTLHLMCPDELHVPKILKDKFNTTKQLFLEIDMDDPGMMQEMMMGMLMKDSSTLQSLLGTRYDSVNATFQNMVGLPLTMMNKMKPLMLMSMIYPSILGCQPDSWESTFMKMAKENNLEVKGLENLSDQVGALEKIPYSIQAGMLENMLLNVDSSKKEINDMLRLYKQKDIQAMQVLSTEKDFSEYESVLLIDRNNNWIPVIAEQAKKMPSFFAFGAGHLGGKDGVINLLRKKGFTVKPIFYE